MRLRSIIKMCLPPFFTKMVLSWIGPKPVVEWGERLPLHPIPSISTNGYQSEKIFQKLEIAAKVLRQNPLCYERDTVLFSAPPISLEVLSALGLVYARTQRKLHILDFGGSIASTYRSHRHLIAPIVDSWVVVDQKRVIDIAREYFNEAPLLFENDIENLQKPFDLAVLGSCLQYLPDAWSILGKIHALNCKHLFIDRTPFCHDSKDHFRIQTVREPIYDAQYLCRIFAIQEFRETLRHEWSPLMEWENVEMRHAEFFFGGGLHERK